MGDVCTFGEKCALCVYLAPHTCSNFELTEIL